MAGPWENYQSTSAAESSSDGPWSNYQEQSQPQDQQQSQPDQTSQSGDMVSAAEQKYGLPAGLLSAVISKESSGNSKAVSGKGAIGLTQVMPATAKGMGYDPEELKNNPAMQVDAGAKYLKQMLDMHGNVPDALAAYNWGPGNVQKYKRGEKSTVPEETLKYVNDPRFAQWTQPQQQQAPQQSSESQPQPMQQDASPDDELASMVQQSEQSWSQENPQPSAGDIVSQAGKGLAQTAVNVANVPAEVLDAAKSAGAWGANQLGMGDGTYQPTQRFELPESIRPTDQYARLGAEIGPYLIPGIGAERSAAALSSAAGGGRVERLMTQAANMLSENTPGALAQSTQNNDFGGNIATGLAGSVIGRGALAAGGRAAGAIRGALQREGQASSVAASQGESVASRTDTSATSRQGEANTSPAEQQKPSVGDLGDDLSQGFDVGQPSVPGQPSMSDVSSRVGAAADSGTAARMADAARDVAPRQDVINAAKSLGIKEDDLLLSHVSGNEAYRAFEQAMASVPGSQLATQEGQVLNKIAKRAAELTDTAGALPNKASMNDKFISTFQRGISTVQNKSDQIYNEISSAIPKNQTVDATNIISHLDRKADELGGAEFLSPMEKKVYNAVSPTGESSGAPTYARLDNIRKQIGQAIGKNSGPFRDEETGALKQLYANLTADQEAVVNAAGMGEKWDLAKRLIGVRRNMEDSMTGLLGRDLRGDVGTKAGLAVRNLAKGDAKGFRALQQDIPSPRVRRAVIATSLRDAFSQGSRKENEFSLPGFVDWYQGMKSSGTLPMIERELGGRTAGQLRNLFTLSQAVRTARESSIKTGRLSSFIKQFDADDGVMDKIYRHGKGALVTTMLGHIPLVGPTLSYGAVAGMAAKEAARPARSVAADRLLSSPEFRSVVKESAGKKLSSQGQRVTDNKMEARIAKSSAWKEFYKTLTKAEKQAIARVGIIGWLSGEGDGSQY